MTKLNLTLLVIFLSLLVSSVLVKSSMAKHNPQTVSYIESSCNGTLYQDLCIRCLAKYVNNYSTIDGPHHLAQVALSVSLSRALHTRGYLMKLAKELKTIKNKRDYLTVKDCANQISDSVDQLSQAIKELSRCSQRGSTINDDSLWHISNVETWVSTALTDASSCVYSFTGIRMSKRMAAIKVKAQNVAEVTSNALALFRRYALSSQQSAARTTKKP
ncbi:PREDICTED: 21 kDa protein-like [Lupinus angustifolius]|nr:PREDICTED: 21 kDa protein-like [Lupinus angustifolius]